MCIDWDVSNEFGQTKRAWRTAHYYMDRIEGWSYLPDELVTSPEEIFNNPEWSRPLTWMYGSPDKWQPFETLVYDYDYVP